VDCEIEIRDREVLKQTTKRNNKQPVRSSCLWDSPAAQERSLPSFGGWVVWPCQWSFIDPSSLTLPLPRMGSRVLDCLCLTQHVSERRLQDLPGISLSCSLHAILWPASFVDAKRFRSTVYESSQSITTEWYFTATSTLPATIRIRSVIWGSCEH